MDKIKSNNAVLKYSSKKINYLKKNQIYLNFKHNNFL